MEDKLKILNIKINSDLENISDSIKNINKNLKNLKLKVSNLKRNNDRVEKILNIKKERKDKQYKVSGFLKKKKISSELYNFLKRVDDSITDELSLSDTTRLIFKYIKDNDLRDKEDLRLINPDIVLKDLLKIDLDTKLTYFNIQHFIKPLR